MQYHLTKKSANRKTGPIPVSTTSSDSCPQACSFRGNGCYAESGPLAIHWRRVGRAGMDLDAFCASIRALPDGQLWRHNQAGDLPGNGNRIDSRALAKLVKANRGRRGFTYTHKPVTDSRNHSAVSKANQQGFTVNLSADNLQAADRLKSLGIGPVVTVLPSTQTTNTRTPAGNLVVVCPAVTHDVPCSECGLCAWADREVIIGFPAHGSSKKRVDALIQIGG